MWIMHQAGNELINLDRATEVYVKLNRIHVDNLVVGTFKTPEDADYVWREMITGKLRVRGCVNFVNGNMTLYTPGDYIEIPKADYPYLPSNRKENGT